MWVLKGLKFIIDILVGNMERPHLVLKIKSEKVY